MNTHSKIETISSSTQKQSDLIDIVLVGAGIMSATLGTFISILEPNWKVCIYERLKKPAQESSNSWNNAGTGHAAFCELNYTEFNNKTNSINIKKATSINSAFELSLQFWSYLTSQNILKKPQSFINNIPHMSFVWGEKNIFFLKKRFQALKKNILFNSMVYSENPQQIHSWIPIVMEGRSKYQKVAATRVEMGTDINFEEITQQLLSYLKKCPNFKINLQHQVTNLQHISQNNWNVKIIDSHQQKKYINTRYIFIGGGGQTLNLLQTANIKEILGYAGFPVGGQFLVTYNPKIISRHSAKVYGKTSINMPPMSVPHIDTRILDNKKILLFGPFATFSSKFLKYGSWSDLFQSINKNNFIPMIQSGIDNFELIKYLIKQLIMSNKARINALKEYYPNANPKDWSLIKAGQRVQIIKKDHRNRGILQFGTEIIHTNNGKLSALLGASPGASVSVSIAIKLLYSMFPDKICSELWEKKLTEIVPSYTQTFDNKSIISLSNRIRKKTRDILELLYIE